MLLFTTKTCRMTSVPEENNAEASRAALSKEEPAATLAGSRTCESLQELAAPKATLGTPSLVSSGYGSQAASSTNLSSEDSLSMRSISVDETPEPEGGRGLLGSLTLPGSSLLLSPPDVSLASSSPGEETDLTVTETSSTTITPSQSVELPGRPSPPPEVGPVLRRSASARRGLRASCSSTSGDQEANKLILLSCRHSVPELSCGPGEELDAGSPSGAPDWLQVGESVQLRPSNNSGVVAYLGGTQFAAGLWVGVELDTPQGKNDGSVKGVRYFSCPAKRGMFVRPRNLKLDKRGREMRQRRRNKENDSFELGQRQTSAGGKSKMRNK